MTGHEKKRGFDLISSEYYHFRKKYRDNGFVFVSSAGCFLYFIFKNIPFSYKWILLILCLIYGFYGLSELMKFFALPSFPQSYIRQCLENPKECLIDLVLLKEGKRKNPKDNLYTLSFVGKEGHANSFSFTGKEKADDIFRYVTALFAGICETGRITSEELYRMKKEWTQKE